MGLPVLYLCKTTYILQLYINHALQTAVGKHFRDNCEHKHKRDAKNGWYRYDSRFALPIYDDKGELERYNVFHASMLVRHSNDGKLYLYDVRLLS